MRLEGFQPSRALDSGQDLPIGTSATGETPMPRENAIASTDRRECVLIGLRREKEELNRRISLRVKKMVEAGLVAEAKHLFDTVPLSPQAAAAVGYAELFDHFQGRRTLDDAIEQIKINTRQLAKKQRTWQRRWNVQWFDCKEHDTAEGVADRVMAAVEFR